MKTYQRGEHIHVSVEVRTLVGALSNASSGCTVTIYDSKHTKLVDASAMTNDSTGKYSLAVATASTWIRGEYLLRIIITDTTGTVYIDENFFLEILTESGE